MVGQLAAQLAVLWVDQMAGKWADWKASYLVVSSADSMAERLAVASVVALAGKKVVSKDWSWAATRADS